MERIVNDCKQLAITEEDLRDQINALRMKIFVEQQSLNLKVLDRDNLSLSNKNIENVIGSNREQVNYLKDLNQDLNKVALTQAILKKVLEELEPNHEHQLAQYARLQDDYNKLLKQYEDSSEYRAILEAEAEDRKLSAKLIELRNELMQLETHRDLD